MSDGVVINDVQDRFDRVMAQVRSRLSKRQFQTWFDRTSVLSWKDSSLVVGVPNRFYQVWFQSKFTDLVRESAEQVSHAPVSVAFEIDGEAQGKASGEEKAPSTGSQNDEVVPQWPGGQPPAEQRPNAQSSEPQPADARRPSPHATPQGSSHPARTHAPTRDVYPAPFAGSGEGDMPLRLNELYSFDNFIIGPSNSVAHASARAVAQNPGRAYNPLFVHGSVGLGKTHLLHAVCHEFLQRFPTDRVCFLSCEEFTNEFVRSLQHNDVDSFRARFRNVHLLVIDDIHFLKGKERTQEEFFHTFNGLYQSNRQIVLSSDAAPNEIPTLEDRLVSRFTWGLVSQLEQPEMETRMAIVRRKAELMHIDVSNEVVEFIAANFRNNIRELEGALLSTKAYADVQGSPVSLQIASEALRQNLKPAGMGITLDRITQLICERYQVKVSDLRSKRRGRSVSEPRQVIMFIARKLTKLSLQEIGDHFGGRDHSTVLYAVRQVENRYGTDPAFAATMERMVDRLGGSLREES